MGTRNIVCVVKDKKFVLAQYCQWDGHLDSKGKEMVDFFLLDYDEKKFESGLKQLYVPGDKEWKKISAHADSLDNWAAVYPQFDRSNGTAIMGQIQQLTNVLPVRLDNSFGMDGSCEYAYVFDWDNKELEMYVSFTPEVLPHINKKNRFKGNLHLVACVNIDKLRPGYIDRLEASLEKDVLLDKAEKAVKENENCKTAKL